MAEEYLQSISEVYARAIFDLARDNSLLEQVGDDLAGICQCIDSDKDFAEFLATPAIALEVKNALLEKIFADKVEPLTADFIKVLVNRGRLEAFTQINLAYNSLRDRAEGRVYGTITTAIELTTADYNSICNSVCDCLGKQVILKHKVDPGIIGGMTLRIGNTVMDGSIKKNLSTLAVALKNQISADASVIIDDTN